MANLAIKGHATRGSEVIALLEMLGGINNRFKLDGLNENFIYYICPEYNNDIHSAIIPTNQIVFSLEEFEEKFPYKVGDKVMTDDGDKANIVGIIWDNDIDDVFYEIQIDTDVVKYPKELLQPYIVETITIDDFKANTKEWLIDKLYDMIISDAVKTISNIHDELHKPKHPKTYKGCCEILDILGNINIEGYKKELLLSLQQLLICRDAYWKIAGEEMELDKHWKPTLHHKETHYAISNVGGKLKYERYGEYNAILAFPTEEMRDAFYENFKDLIEAVKELL